MVAGSQRSGIERKVIQEEVYQQRKQMSNGAPRNLLRLTYEIEKRNSDILNRDDCQADKLITCQTDFNRNSLVDPAVSVIAEDICEVITTEITERKTRKKNSAIHTIRNLVRATVISPTSESSKPIYSNSAEDVGVATNNDNIDSDKTDATKNRRKKMSVGSMRRKKRNRKSRAAIPNEGASLWKPLENNCWRSAGGRNVQLDEIALNILCDAERNALKKLSIIQLHEAGLECEISIPKVHHAVARGRWKHILNLKRKGKSESAEKGASAKPANPVFSTDLFQAIENDKAVDRAHQIAMKKLDQVGEEDETNESEANNKENEFLVESRSSMFYERRNSDPISLDHKTLSFHESRLEYGNHEASNYMLNALRTIDTLKEEPEEDTISNKRKSRLIEALTLSSTSASSMCILDREIEFKPHIPEVPKVIVETVDYISKYALNTIGIFRTGGAKKRVRQMKEDYDSGHSCVITEESNPHDVAALLKEFLRCLPDPLLTRELYPAFLSASKLQTQEDVLYCLKLLVWLLPVPNRDTLQVTLDCLQKVANHSQDTVDEEGVTVFGNKMDSQNLATLMAPNILHRCKSYKTSQLYQVDTGLNPEDNKASIEIVEAMISNNEFLFKISPDTHHEILTRLLDEDPETVDYILKKKSTRTSLVDVIAGMDEEIIIPSTLPSGKRPSSAGPRTKFSHDEVAFYNKSSSFNQGPYKPFIRKRRESSGSRPTSTRSDPAERNSIRKSGMGTPPFRQNRKSSKVQIDSENGDDSRRNSSSPRDSGVVMSPSFTPPFQRNSLRSSFDAKLYKNYEATNTTKIVRRKFSRDRDSMDSAYDSGMQGMFSNRQSSSMNFTEDEFNDKDVISDIGSPKSPTMSLSEVLEAPSFVPIPNSPENRPPRKISLPVFPSTDRHSLTNINKSTSVDGVAFNENIVSKIDWNSEENWPDWSLNPRESQFPSQETRL